MIQKLHTILRVAAALVILYAVWVNLQPATAKPELTPIEIREIETEYDEMIQGLNNLKREYNELRRLYELQRKGKLWMAYATDTRNATTERRI